MRRIADGTTVQRGMEVSNRTAHAGSEIIFGFFAQLNTRAGGRTTAQETHATWREGGREGCMKAERIYSRRGRKDAAAHNALFVHYFLPSLVMKGGKKSADTVRSFKSSDLTQQLLRYFRYLTQSKNRKKWCKNNRVQSGHSNRGHHSSKVK